MAEVFRELIQDLVKETTTSSGTANTSKVIELSGAADSRFQTFATAYGTSATNSVLGIPVTLTEGTTAQQTGLATFTHGTPSTIQFTSIDKGGTGITFTTAATVSIASTSRVLNRVSLRQEAIGITSADYTSAVPNTHYRITISGLTAARSFQLPVTGVKVGDIVSGKIISNAPATPLTAVLSIKTDASGSTVDGVNVGATASTKWVYLIQNEHFAFRCVTAGGAGAMAWESMGDGRIPCFAWVYQSSVSTAQASGVWGDVENWTVDAGEEAGGCADTTGDKWTPRRDGKIQVFGIFQFVTVDNGSSIRMALEDGAAGFLATGPKMRNSTGGEIDVQTGIAAEIYVSAGGTVKWQFRHTDSSSLAPGTNKSNNNIFFQEVL